MMKRTNLKADFLARAEALKRFNEWERRNPLYLTDAQAIESLGAIIEMLPPESRVRPVSTEGIEKMRRALSVLKPRKK